MIGCFVDFDRAARRRDINHNGDCTGRRLSLVDDFGCRTRLNLTAIMTELRIVVRDRSAAW